MSPANSSTTNKSAKRSASDAPMSFISFLSEERLVPNGRTEPQPAPRVNREADQRTSSKGEAGSTARLRLAQAQTTTRWVVPERNILRSGLGSQDDGGGALIAFQGAGALMAPTERCPLRGALAGAGYAGGRNVAQVVGRLRRYPASCAGALTGRASGRQGARVGKTRRAGARNVAQVGCTLRRYPKRCAD
jgi:hypothetical protein